MCSLQIRKGKSKTLVAVKSVWMSPIHLFPFCRWFQWALDDVLQLVCFHSPPYKTEPLSSFTGVWVTGDRVSNGGRQNFSMVPCKVIKESPITSSSAKESFRIAVITLSLKLQNSLQITVTILKVVSSLYFNTGQGTCSWKSPASRI